VAEKVRIAARRAFVNAKAGIFAVPENMIVVSKMYVKKDFQFRFILRFCLLLFIGVVMSTVLLFLFSQDTLTSSFQQSRLVVDFGLLC